MEPCVVIASSCDSIKIDTIVKGILETDDLPEPLCLIEGIRSYPWHIKTKYYEADVHVCAMDQKTIGNQAFADSVNAVVLCFDSASNNGLSIAEQWLTFTKELEADVRILLCERCCTTDTFQSPGADGVSKIEAQTWCVSNGFELVELNPELECDSDVEDDFPESVGMKRVIQALGAHLWPNMVLKESTARVTPFRAFPNGVDGVCRPMNTSTTNSSNPSYNDNRLSDSFPDNRSLEHLPEHPIGTRTSKLVAAVKPIQQSPDREGISNIAIVSPTLLHSQEETMQEETMQVETSVPPNDISPSADEENVAGGSGVPMASISPIITNVSQPTPAVTDIATSSSQQPQQSESSDTAAAVPTRDERIDAVLEAMDSMSEETFEGLFQNLNEMKLKAQSLSPDQRRVYAEQMAIAFWRSIGGNDSEIEGLSSDED